MIVFKCDDKYLDNVVEFAEKRKIINKLSDRFEYLDKYGEHGDRGKTKCVVFDDFSPFSFYFVMQKRDENGEYGHWFNGGCIYYGEGDTGVSFPQFSVRLRDTSEGWSIHT